MTQLLPHIKIETHESGRVFLVIDDYELFDFIDDYLAEKFEIFSESRTSKEREGGEVISLYFPIGVTVEQVSGAISSLSAAEVEEIYRLNNG
ncbi:MAG: hypothetical protein CVU59_03440 [Deltaproteobacteria bacterium HGW-Deltaproteobacteria-17]|nr:MAG: hypothetical protein CVU59_03440 [Deltaproteobacteria bacterium HGW-Deltaproteobacteria-17]